MKNDKTEEELKAIILMGDLDDGYLPVGPFNSGKEAFEWLEKNNTESWPIAWVMDMVPQKEYAEHMKEHDDTCNECKEKEEKEKNAAKSKNDN
ncbi:hypothetical protein HYV49_01035 [Candidatus Pacearchaeota archaeon]|nr:hypothetical protein [Candidatus Pacearchaeota archaeon]